MDYIKLQPAPLTADRPQYALKYAVLSSIAVCFIGLGFVMERPALIMEGFLRIIQEPGILITDSMVIGGIGAALVNSGLLMLLCTGMLLGLDIDITGLSVASVFLMGGFALFGKDIFNIWPIIFGVFLYTKIKKEPFHKYVHVAFLSTSIAPIVTELMFKVEWPILTRVLVSILTGISIGFLITPLAASVMKLHRGFNLYNIGFAVGLLGTTYVSIFKSYGYTAYSRLIWSTGNDLPLGIFLGVLFLLMIASGLLLDKGALKKLFSLFRQPGVCDSDFGVCSSDFISDYGFATVMVNMGVNGLFCTGYVLLVGGALNGPTLGGILTVAGFGAFGKHLTNIIPLFIGVFLGAVTKTWHINDPAILIAALFGTALAPIAGYYGWVWGIVAGFVNSSVVLNSGILHGGMSLYNTGFAAGFVATVMIPLLEAFTKKGRRNKG